MRLAGGCLCGAVRYLVSGAPREVVNCHCRRCQRASGAAFVTWATVPAESFGYSHGKPASFSSSAVGTREFCGACGTQLVFRDFEGGTLDVSLCSLDDPDAFAPQANTWVGTRRPWLHGFDERLPDRDGEWSAD
jgi:hypothetical protein